MATNAIIDQFHTYCSSLRDVLRRNIPSSEEPVEFHLIRENETNFAIIARGTNHQSIGDLPLEIVPHYQRLLGNLGDLTRVSSM